VGSAFIKSYGRLGFETSVELFLAQGLRYAEPVVPVLGNRRLGLYVVMSADRSLENK